MRQQKHRDTMSPDLNEQHGSYMRGSESLYMHPIFQLEKTALGHVVAHRPEFDFIQINNSH